MYEYKVIDYLRHLLQNQVLDLLSFFLFSLLFFLKKRHLMQNEVLDLLPVLAALVKHVYARVRNLCVCVCACVCVCVCMRVRACVCVRARTQVRARTHTIHHALCFDCSRVRVSVRACVRAYIPA